MIFVGVMISGCMSLGGQPSRAIEYYTLEYPPARFENYSAIAAGIRVERFTAVQEFQGNDMVFRPKPYVRSMYRYQRWKTSAADMVTDCVLRDIRDSKIFSSVLAYYDGGDARFLLEGRVAEFMEIDEDKHSRASLVVYAKVSDLFANDGKKRIVLEKTYKMLEPFIKDRQPHELAGAMSAAMEKLSRELIADIYRVAKSVN